MRRPQGAFGTVAHTSRDPFEPGGGGRSGTANGNARPQLGVASAVGGVKSVTNDMQLK